MAEDKTTSLLARLYPNDGGVHDVNLIHLRDFALTEAMAAGSDMLLEADPEGITNMFAEYTERGLSLDSIGKLMCIPRLTLSRWLTRASEGVEPYVSFALAISENEAKLEMNLIDQWQLEKGTRSSSALAMLERRFPDKWKPGTPASASTQSNSRGAINTTVNVQAINIPSNGRENKPRAIDVDFEVDP